MKARKLLANNVRDLRKDAGLTQEKCAEVAGLSLRMLQDIEGEHSWPSPETLEKLADCFRVPESRLFYDGSIKPTPQEALKVLIDVQNETKALRRENQALHEAIKTLTAPALERKK